MSAEQVTMSRNRGKLRESQRICKDGGEASPSTMVDVIELAREDVEAKHTDATRTSRHTDLETDLVKVLAARETLSVRMAAAEGRVDLLQTCLVEVSLTLEKETDESS